MAKKIFLLLVLYLLLGCSDDDEPTEFDLSQGCSEDGLELVYTDNDGNEETWVCNGSEWELEFDY